MSPFDTIGRALLVWLGALGVALAQPALVLTPQAQVLQSTLPRIGINLGSATTWGAEQLMNNVLKNPGFEPGFERALVLVRSIARDTVEDDTPWLGRPDGFWNGARFDVRTGNAAGSGGRVLLSRRAGVHGGGTFMLDPMPPALAPGDALSVQVGHAQAGPALWWVGSGRVTTRSGEVRPGSPGSQVAALSAAPGARAELLHYLDALGARAGKLLPLRGPWRLSFWARGVGSGRQLQLRVRRAPAAEFVRQTVALTSAWVMHTIDFTPNDDGPAGTIALSFAIDEGEVLIDDATLGEVRSGPGGFRREVADLLGQLKPGYLRDWQGQLGDTLENRLATPFARRPVRYRPGEAEQLYLYSLPEFLALCAAVGARPWVVAPTLMNDAEWRALGVFLASAAAQYGFDEIMLEFGNENWNALFRPAGFMGEARQAQAADRGFARLKAGAKPFAGIIPVVNAQFVNPASWGRLGALAHEAARVAVAPYFLFKLDQGSPQAAQAAAFSDSDATLRAGVAAARAQGKATAVSEVNFHTTGGNAGAALRDPVVGGAHSGAALARRLLQATLAGVREQTVYSLAGFDSRTESGALVPLWGVARDLAPGTLRPTGQALALLNSVFGGDVHASACAGADSACAALTALWLRAPGKQSLVVVSATPQASLIRTELACSTPVTLTIQGGPGGAARCVGHWQFTLPAYSLAVLASVSP